MWNCEFSTDSFFDCETFAEAIELCTVSYYVLRLKASLIEQCLRKLYFVYEKHMFLSTGVFFFLSRIVKDIAIRTRRINGQKKEVCKGPSLRYTPPTFLFYLLSFFFLFSSFRRRRLSRKPPEG